MYVARIDDDERVSDTEISMREPAYQIGRRVDQADDWRIIRLQIVQDEIFDQRGLARVRVPMMCIWHWAPKPRKARQSEAMRTAMSCVAAFVLTDFQMHASRLFDDLVHPAPN